MMINVRLQPGLLIQLRYQAGHWVDAAFHEYARDERGELMVVQETKTGFQRQLPADQWEITELGANHGLELLHVANLRRCGGWRGVT